MAHVFSVGELTRAIKDVLEGEFPFVWVRGQISNLARPSSGHVYFTLKDQDACLSVVWFKNSQWRSAVGPDPSAGPAAALAEGLEATVAGRLGVYAPRGSYQIIAEMVQPLGAGDLHLAFEALKRKLAALGWFDQARKRPLPANPCRVAVVTAKSGAAIRDFLRLAADRGAGATIRVHPCLVQGEAAPRDISRAMAEACADGWAEVVALIRGGGSTEDLWAFNAEETAEAVVRAPVPVVCGVGHEVDVSIADLAADVRAATPSHAAQILWPERRTLVQRVDELEMRLGSLLDRFFDAKSRELEAAEKGLSWLTPERGAEELVERFWREEAALTSAAGIWLERKSSELERAGERLRAAFGPRDVEASLLRLQAETGRLVSAGTAWLERSSAELERSALRLEGLDPLAPVRRGYSLTRLAETGEIVRSPEQVAAGQRLDILVADGRIAADVVKE